MARGPDATLAPVARDGTAESPANAETARPGTVLELDDVGVRFGGISALESVSLTVADGVVCGLIGPNGAGKTTLFDVISGVRLPDDGCVRFLGSDVTRASAVARARAGMRRTFQRVQTFGWLSVEDNVLAALEWRGGGGGILADVASFPSRRSRERGRRARVEAVLEQCGLTAVRADPVGSLPIGLARMVELARAIVDEPRLLLLDEPTSGLDEHEAERLVEQLQRLKSSKTCAVIVVEHDMGFVMQQCDEIAVLELGRVIATGAPKVIQEDPLVRAAYLGGSSNHRNVQTSNSKGGQP
jgi:branched-chain amino acid transport system ATP-binding protein